MFGLPGSVCEDRPPLLDDRRRATSPEATSPSKGGPRRQRTLILQPRELAHRYAPGHAYAHRVNFPDAGTRKRNMQASATRQNTQISCTICLEIRIGCRLADSAGRALYFQYYCPGCHWLGESHPLLRLIPHSLQGQVSLTFLARLGAHLGRLRRPLGSQGL